jgi:hypothetical protein
MYVTDVRHFLDEDGFPPDGLPGPARRLLGHLSGVIRAATARDAGVEWTTTVPCRRRPRRAPCAGRLVVHRTDVPSSITWHCPACGDDGVITGWRGTLDDLSDARLDGEDDDWLNVHIPRVLHRAIARIGFMALECERVVAGAMPADVGTDAVVLRGRPADFEELIGCIAFEANHASNRRTQRELDTANDVLRTMIDVAESVRPPRPSNS